MIYLGIGSNIGNRLANLRKALLLLKAQQFFIVKESIVLETTAILPANAPADWNKPYLNMIVCGTTKLCPTELLFKLQQIEQQMGRTSIHEKWSPRIIDLDILLWGQDIIDITTPPLKIPHPELVNRPFWLHLMAMLAPEHQLPSMDMSLAKLAHQQLSLKSCFTKSFVLKPQLVGVINITPDSFSDGGLYLNPAEAIKQTLRLHEEGAAVIEIGAQSTRPRATMLSSHEEEQRLVPVLEGLKDIIKTNEIKISLDSFCKDIILAMIKHYAIAWVNDVKGLLNKPVLSKIADQGCSIVAMHSLSIPPSSENIIDNTEEVFIWAQKKVEQLRSCGFSSDKIILDPGIGFGKSVYQNLWLIKHVSILKKLGCPILVGHSRKSYINAFFNTEASKRDVETIALSDVLAKASVDYLRVHAVAEHQRFFVAKKSISALGIANRAKSFNKG